MARLEKKGFVQTRRDEHDRRVKHVCLTETGRSRCVLVREKINCSEQLLSDSLTQEERAELRRLLTVVYNTFNSDGEACTSSPVRKGNTVC